MNSIECDFCCYCNRNVCMNGDLTLKIVNGRCNKYKVGSWKEPEEAISHEHSFWDNGKKRGKGFVRTSSSVKFE